MADKGQITGQQVLSDDVFTRLEKFDAALAGIPSRYTAIEESAKKATSNSGFEAAVKKSNDLNNETNVLLKEQKKLEDNLIRTKAKNKLLTESTARALAKQRFETQQQNRENKRAAILTSSTAGAYKKLSTELNNAKDKLKDLIVTQGEFSTAATKQRTEVDKLSAKIKKADNVAGDFQRNVGNYPSALRPVVGVLKGLVGAFGIVEGLRIGSRIVKETIALAREAKGVEFAFDRIGESGINAFDGIRKSTRGLISELDIKKAIVDFDNFNISLAESSVLFEFLALRSAQTGKSIDSLRDSLVEGLSKESKLRIDNLGISVVELNEELEKTPNFVKAVGVIAKREVSQAGNILDEAANGGEKFNASMENLKL